MFWLSNPIFRLLRSNTLISQSFLAVMFVRISVCADIAEYSIHRSSWQQSFSILFDRLGSWDKSMEFPVIFVIELVDAYHGSQAGERQMANECTYPCFPWVRFWRLFSAFFPKNLLYWDRKFNQIQLYICIFGVPGISFWGHIWSIYVYWTKSMT